MADRILRRREVVIRSLVRNVGPPGPPGADGDTGSTDPASAAAAGIVKINTDDPGDDPVVYRKGEVDTLLAAKATAAALVTEAANRAAADLALASDLDDESDARIAGDAALDVRVDALELAPPAHTHPESEITGLVADLAAKAPLASPALTGTPTAPTATAGTNTGQLATTAYVIAAIAALINSAPGALDTLDELAAAMGDDANFAATVTTALAGKQASDAELTALAGLVSAANKLPYFTGSGTAALADLSAFARTLLDDADAATARTTLGAASQVDLDAVEDASIAADVLLDGRLDAFEGNANLTALMALVGASDRAAYFTAAGALSLYTLTAFGRTLGGLADAAAGRTAFGLGTLATVSPTGTPDGAKFLRDDNVWAAPTATVADDAITNAKLANVATATIKGRATAGTGDPEDLTPSQVRTVTGLVIGTDVAAQADARFPTADEKAALSGAGGVPTATNPFVTTSDPRLIPPPSVSAGTYLVSGATIAWKTALTFTVGAATYYLDGVLKTSAETDVTLTTADVSNARIDVLVLDATGPTKVTGTASASPAEPTVDPSTYLRLGLVNVAAGLTAISVTETPIWKEDTGTDWTAVPSGGSIVIASTSNPRTGTKDIEGTAVAAAANVVFTIDSGSIDISTQDKLVFYVRVKSAWPIKKALAFTWLAGAVTKGATVTVGNGLYGLNSQSAGAYQQIVVPISAFSVPAGSAITKLRMEVTGSGASIGFYLDDMILQAGITQGAAASPFRWRGTWISTAAYDQNDVVLRTNATYIALQGSTSQDPVTAATYWAKLGGTTPVPLWVSANVLSPLTSPNAKSDAWDDSSGNSGSVNGLAAKWTAAGATQTRAYTQGKLVVTGTASASNGTSNASIATQSAPSTPITLIARVQPRNIGLYCAGGIFVRASSSGKFWAPTIYINSTTDLTTIIHTGVSRYTSNTVRASFSNDTNITAQGGLGGVWLMLVYDGSLLNGYFSFDGEIFFGNTFAEAKTTHFGADTIDQIGWFVDGINNISPVVGFGQFLVS